MNPVRTFDQITQEILDKYDYKTITVGILIADGNQTAARDYIINYMDKFDILSQYPGTKKSIYFPDSLSNLSM